MDKAIALIMYNKILLGVIHISYGNHLTLPYGTRKIKII